MKMAVAGMGHAGLTEDVFATESHRKHGGFLRFISAFCVFPWRKELPTMSIKKELPMPRLGEFEVYAINYDN